ncbi:hypothetical protein F5148DRAFT_89558 [Russula earlei]|uniref:Uncharacterized protein n=1 Tax=Russula earlei TaxID=71964 RepID=A0ACC0U962_9AGAM|nr:hypothetical protein F5148DRAFT_89558 [Russula earlei]
MRDGPPSEISTTERIRALEVYNRAWRELAWSAYDKIDIPASGTPQFSDGIAVSPDKRALAVHRLSSKLRGVEFDFAIAYFTLALLRSMPRRVLRDGTVYLSVLSPLAAGLTYSATFSHSRCEPRILLRTLSNGQPHPLVDIGPRDRRAARREGATYHGQRHDGHMSRLPRRGGPRPRRRVSRRPARDLELEGGAARAVHADGHRHRPEALPRRSAHRLPEDRLGPGHSPRATQTPARVPL